jgi:hypothetical protein
VNQALREKLAHYGVWTYRAAWALEFTAAAIGLTTGIVLGYQAFSASETASAADLMLASAPFFMVALAELTKIPIATLLFSVKWIWKPILLLFLLLLAAITFETVFMGLERATTLRQLRYQELVEKKRQTEAELSALSRDLSTVDKDYAVQQAQANIENVNQLAEKERASILSRVEEVDKQHEGQVILTPEAASIRDKLKELETGRETRLTEQVAELAAALEGFG